MSESIQHRMEHEDEHGSAAEVLLFRYNMGISAVADREASDAALQSLAAAFDAVGAAWLEALPRKEAR